MIPLLFTYGLTAMGAFYGVTRPFCGLLVYIALSIIRPMGLWPGDVPPGPYSQIVAICALIGWLLHGMGDFRLGRGKWIALNLLAFWTWAVISASFALKSDPAWDAVIELSKILLPVVIGFTLIRSAADLRALAWTMVLSQSVIALAGHVTVYLGSGENWLNTQGLAGYDNNDLAAGMVAMVGVAFGLGLAETVPRLKWFAFFCAGLIGHAILMSQSRGAMLGFCITGMMTVAFVWKEPQNRKFIWLALLAGILLAGPSIRGRFLTIFEEGRDRQADLSASTRFELWGIAWQVARENPFTGIGPANFLHHVTTWYHRKKVVHSLWLQTACEFGIVGLLILVALYASCWWNAWKLYRHKPPYTPFLRSFTRIVLWSVPGFCVSASFLSIIYLEQPYYLILLSVGVLKLAVVEYHSAAVKYKSRGAGTRYSQMAGYRRPISPVSA